MEHSELFRINIAIAAMHRLTYRILDVSDEFKNTNVPIHERVCVSPPPYYIDWFDRYYPNVSLNQYEGTFFLQCMNGIQGTKPYGRQWNILLDAVVIILRYKNIKIDHPIYIRVFYDRNFPILRFILMIFSTLLIIRQNLLN